MREIGGYIEFEYFCGREYHEGALALNSGRHCVEYLIRAEGIKKLYMPYFMCDSVSSLCLRLGVDVGYYHTDIDFCPRFEGELGEGEWLYVVNYYGQLDDRLVAELQKKYGRVILDNAQAFFKKPIGDIPTCYTCRKFFGVSDGGYLYTDKLLDREIAEDESYERMRFLFGRAERSAGEFYSEYIENNKRFAAEELKKMSKTTRNLMRGIDYERVRQIRNENFAYLHESLKNINKLKLSLPEGGFMYPLYIEGGAEIRRELQEKKIFIPTLWPKVFEVCTEDELEYDMAKNILPLPIDQRYGREQMDEMIKSILL